MVNTLSGALSSQGCPRAQSLGPYYLSFMWMISAVSSNIPPLSCLLMMLLSSRRLILFDDCFVLQKDLDAVLDWSSKWLLRLNPEKCAALSITNKHHPIMYTYQLLGRPIIWSPVIRYLGVYISSSLKWTDHCSHIAKDSFKYSELYSPCYVHMHLRGSFSGL